MRNVIASFVVICVASMACVARAGGVVNVTPANMNDWTINSFDDNGNIVNSGPYYGTAAMVPGPATPPIGTGSAELATPIGFADGAAAIATEKFDGMFLSSITALSYATYDVTNNGQQFPYLAISINTNDVHGDTDTLFFEPPYQEPSTGNPTLPDQGATVQNEWQIWNAYVGGFWDNNGIGDPGVAENGNPGVEPLSAFLAAYPNATIANGGFPGLGGIALQVGFESNGDTEVGYVDDFTIGINGVNTTYNFDPSSTPLPKTAWSGGLLMAGLALWKLRQRRAELA
jgi:hypothetical protein